jgi:DNA polymerase-1
MELSRVVSVNNFEEVVRSLEPNKFLSFDTETTGLKPFHGDILFSCIFGASDTTWYFNFNDYQDDQQCPKEYTLPREFITKLQPLFYDRFLYMHNAKFDWHFVKKEGIDVAADVWCTETMARVIDNDHLEYSLDACVARALNKEKDDAVEAYVKAHKLWKWVQIPGKKTRFKEKFYNQVPFEIIVPYGHKDASLTFELGEWQRNRLTELSTNKLPKLPPISNIVNMEIGVTRVCQQIEETGILINKQYCKEAAKYEHTICRETEGEFERVTGVSFKDSNRVFAEVFGNLGVGFGLTAKGNPTFTDDALGGINHPVADIIRRHRTAHKRLNTYFKSYTYWADDFGVIHPGMRQAGTTTGRFSFREPNLQNVPKERDDAGKDLVQYPVRRAFVPRENYCFVAIDYNQMEFRLMLDYAGQEDLIEKIMGGYDPHTATAELVGIDRRPAKVLNFGLLYGMGIGKLADTLGISSDEARSFRNKYFSQLPKVKRFLRACSDRAEAKGVCYDWCGRKFNFPDPQWAYKAANAIIQGGCASVVKRAMVDIHPILAKTKSRTVLQVHDELLFEIHKDEMELVKVVQDTMEKAYPHKRIPLTCSVEHSWKSYGDLRKGVPT